MAATSTQNLNRSKTLREGQITAAKDYYLGRLRSLVGCLDVKLTGQSAEQSPETSAGPKEKRIKHDEHTQGTARTDITTSIALQKFKLLAGLAGSVLYKLNWLYFEVREDDLTTVFRRMAIREKMVMFTLYQAPTRKRCV